MRFSYLKNTRLLAARSNRFQPCFWGLSSRSALAATGAASAARAKGAHLMLHHQHHVHACAHACATPDESCSAMEPVCVLDRQGCHRR